MAQERRSIKDRVATFLSTITEIKKVYKGFYRRSNLFPNVVISIPNENETRASVPAGSGKRRVDYVVRLTIINIDKERDEIESELAFDDLIDTIEQKIRENPTLGGTVLTAGVGFIRTEVAEPRLASEDQGSVFRAAVIELDVVDVVTG